MNTIKKPQARRRKKENCPEWLEMLEPSEIKKRWPVSGAAGLYEHERLWIARYCAFEEIRMMAQQDLRDKADRQQEARRVSREMQEKASEDAAAKRAESLATIRESIQGLESETHGTVQEAAMRASNLYLDGSTPRSMKQCIAIAAAEHLVSFSSIQAYLAGVGIRVLWARVAPGEI